MIKTELNGRWKMRGAGFECEGSVPGSVYSFLLENKLAEDPFYRENELEALKILENEFTFSRTFSFAPNGDRVLLHCDGLDTLCDIYLNGAHVAYTDNMHRAYEFDVTDILKKGENEISILFHPIDPYIKKKHAEHPVPAARSPLHGFSHIRKAQCMMGWDWGPRIPDIGIWKNIYLLTCDSARISDLHITQRHENGRVFITPCVTVENLNGSDSEKAIKVNVTAPDGETIEIAPNAETEIPSPKLWWPNGMGEQPLYKITAVLTEGQRTVDICEKKIGLRTLKLIRERDKYGESFCHEVNGIRFFAMGADYIPMDSVLSRVTDERIYWMLRQCRDCNFNAIRVWGGGYYPEDSFMEACDEMGIIVFMDLMFACTLLWVDGAFLENVRAEIGQNLTRLRHHACLAVISGNNEIECNYENCEDVQLREMYYSVFEDMIPSLISEICPYIPYIPSSPTTCGHFIDPQNENYGDSHYWEVWHGGKPFTEFRNHLFRYLSEFGFQSFPCEKTVNAFTKEEDRNIFSRVMERHQRNTSANGKILNYLSNTFLYPRDFSTLLYASQLLQAEAIRYGVEHFRRNRGRCMGTLYWQLNDIWPVASWASIDYYGRYKALQYVARRFYSPVLLSCKETGEKDTRPSIIMEEKEYPYETKAQLCVTNDTLSEIKGTVFWALRDNTGAIVKDGSEDISVPALSVLWLDEMDFEKTDVEHNYFSYNLKVGGEEISCGTALFTAPKHFEFSDPHLRCELCGDEITVYADAFARCVEIDSPDSDFILSDNYFDMNAGQKTVKILSGVPKTIKLRSVYDIR